MSGKWNTAFALLASAISAPWLLAATTSEEPAGPDPSVCVVTEQGCLALDEILVKIELGQGNTVIDGGQFFLQYDPAFLQFVSASPGATCDPSSPFAFELIENVDEVAGEIFYAVGISFLQGGQGTQGPATLACLAFTTTGIAPSEVCLSSGVNPSVTILIGQSGQTVPIDNSIACPTQQPAPILSCGLVQADEQCLCEPGTDDCSSLDTECRVGICNGQTGACHVEFTNSGGSCDDGNPCTSNDMCLGGTCRGFDCVSTSLCITESRGCPFPGGLVVRVELGEGSTPIVGGQFSIQYDPTALELVNISPGAACAPPFSPFSVEFFAEIDHALGEVFYAVGVAPLSGASTTGPATMACLTFNALTQELGQVCLFNGDNPRSTLIVDGFGQAVHIDNRQDCPTNTPIPIVACADVCDVPTVSQWGLVALTLLLLTAGKLRFGRCV